MRPTASAVLQTLAALSPIAEQRSVGRTVPLDWFRWMPAAAVRLFAPGPNLLLEPPSAQWLKQVAAAPNDVMTRAVPIDHRFAERLAAVDQIRVGSSSLRVGWLFVAGRAPAVAGPAVRVLHPLVTVPVRVQRLLLSSQLIASGDAEITPLIADLAVRGDLEGHMEFGGGALDSNGAVGIPSALLARLDRLRRFALSAAKAAGLPADQLIPAGDGPEELLRSDHLQIVAGVAVYAVSETSGSSRASTLRAWAGGPVDDTRTAFHAMYLPTGGSSEADRSGGSVESPYLLTPTQRSAVIRSRNDPLTVVSGAPGTGKSHTIVAIACDALARGQSVMVAAKSDDAVDALIDLLERSPGPNPVVFGSHERRDALARRLAEGQLQPTKAESVAEDRRLLDLALRRRDAVRWSICQHLQAEVVSRAAPSQTDVVRLTAPGLFESGLDFEHTAELVMSAAAAGGGWFRRRRRRRDRRDLDRVAGTSSTTPMTDIISALAVAQAMTVADDQVREGGLELVAAWEELLEADDAARLGVAKWLSTECRSARRINQATLTSIAALATALRSGRAARRAQLGRVDRKIIRALPLWIGSLPDIDDLLPPLPALFDIVILDEASSIDQPLAAAALLRAARAAIVGDPHQLRHVSFLSDQQIQAAISAGGLEDWPELAGRLDVRRNSAFDVAAGVAPVTKLNEHFRSDPHLIDWVARKIYGEDLKIATLSPATESKDCIEVTRVKGHRDKKGVVKAEVDEVISQLQQLRRLGADSVGVVTPFRAQADALEAAILSAFSADDLESMNLRVGTVHAFQGNERDTILASVAVGPEEPANSWRFVEDPHLFDVLVTRARKSFRLVVSADPPIGSLVADYLKQADSPPGRPRPVGVLDAWSQVVGEHLQTSGLQTADSYPTGRHVVDLCVSTPDGSASIECTVHPEGPEAHVERHLALQRAGWRILDAYKSKWGERLGELTVELVGLLTPDQ